MRWHPELDAQRQQNRMIAIVGMQTKRIPQVDPLLGAALINFGAVPITNRNQPKVVDFADDSKIVADLQIRNGKNKKTLVSEHAGQCFSFGFIEVVQAPGFGLSKATTFESWRDILDRRNSPSAVC